MIITVEFDADTGTFDLYVASHGTAPMPAGPRLFRRDPPEIKFQHIELESAEADAEKLRIYLDSLAPAKRLTKRQMAEGPA